MKNYYEIKKELSCKALLPAINAAQKKNIALNEILEGIPYGLSHFLNKNERIEWWIGCKIIAGMRKYFSPSDFEQMGRDFVIRWTFIEGYIINLLLFTSSKFTRIVNEKTPLFGNSITKPLFSCIEGKMSIIEKNKYRFDYYIEPGYEHCPELFYMSKGVWDKILSQVGLKSYKIELSITPTGGIFTISWIKVGWFTKLKTWINWLFNIRKALADLTQSHDELSDNYNKLAESQKQLTKQTTQLNTAYNITKSIRQTSDVDKTLNAITEALVNDAGFSSAYIELFKDIEGSPIMIKASNGVDDINISPIKHPVILNDECIGQLIIYPKIDADLTDLNELLNYLIPIINISIHDTLVLRAITDYKNNLETKVDERTSELQEAQNKLSELMDQQNRFFTNISHEFRTPLTLIYGPSKQIIERTNDDKVKNDAELINRNARKLNRLANQLLDISRIEAGRMKLKTSELDLVPILKRIVYSFKSFAERKSISLNFDTGQQNIILYIDEDKIDKIISNILSNALKFTQDKGYVNVKSCVEKNVVEIKISDNGIGIPEEKIDKIFDRFYQLDNRLSKDYEGTGVGLSLTKELVELHKGKIEVESCEGKGTTVVVKIPLGKEHLKTEEIFEKIKNETDKTNISSGLIYNKEEETNRLDFDFITEGDKPLLLIIEDNFDVRNYIKGNLKKDYRITEAVDGKDGLNKSVTNLPDLIVSDVMMPEMDGFQLCEKLKTDERTSHIPLILLTAKATISDKLNGLETGADDYIMKPFEIEELSARIKNLIEQRKRIHEYFKKKGIFELNEAKITSVDKKLLQNVLNIINDNISDPSFGVESLAENLAVSRYVLYKKIISLTGESPVELIRRIKLLQAANLIENKFGNLSEIALEVGFNNPAYFSECFKKQFGVPPSQYPKNNKTE